MPLPAPIRAAFLVAPGCPAPGPSESRQRHSGSEHASSGPPVASRGLVPRPASSSAQVATDCDVPIGGVISPAGSMYATLGWACRAHRPERRSLRVPGTTSILWSVSSFFYYCLIAACLTLHVSRPAPNLRPRTFVPLPFVARSRLPNRNSSGRSARCPNPNRALRRPLREAGVHPACRRRAWAERLVEWPPFGANDVLHGGKNLRLASVSQGLEVKRKPRALPRNQNPRRLCRTM